MQTTGVALTGDERLPNSIIEARNILQQIRLERGFLGNEHEEELSHLRIETRQAVARLAEIARRKTAKYTTSIAGELYSLKSRFIYELLQNADDSKYGNNQGEPCVTIDLFPDRISIGTNEEGFTIANVKAICETGESSKKASSEDQSIGEKGYGFKSVFGVAYRARIQSGHWSFYFEHRDGDDGLGMITPIDIDPVALPVGVSTKIELLLQEDSSDLFDKLSQELTDLHETTIFFLQKIKILVIRIHPNEGPDKRIEIRSDVLLDRPRVLNYTVSLTRKDILEAYSEIISTKLYHVCEHNILDMPVDKHRKGRDRSKLKLAFPFDPTTNCPIIDADGQHVFAYLPLYRKPNLPFLIQGDFITSTNRESVLDCDWNARLRAGVAEAFLNATQQFYFDDILRYMWLNYLPILLKGNFESRLFSLIKGKLQDAQVFQTWQQRTRTYPLRLRILTNSYMHDDMPLFEDLEDEAYLAPEYSCVAQSTLVEIGITYMTQLEFLERLVYDLGRTCSRFRTTPAADLWHETCSRALSRVLSSRGKRAIQIIRNQKIIPLRSTSGMLSASKAVDEWRSAFELETGPVYFPDTQIDRTRNTTATRDSILIPGGLQIRVLYEEYSAGACRTRLFAELGVIPCTPILVKNAIFDLHNSRIHPKMSLATYVSHLQYLFWFYDLHSPINLPLYVAGEHRNSGYTVDRATKPFYLKSEGPFDTWSLLQNSSELERDKLAAFISDYYVAAESSSARSYGRSWLQWLEEIVCLRRRPPLLEGTSSSPRMSPIMLHILANSPESFLPTLQAHWAAEYHHIVTNSHAVKELISQTEVQCEQTSPSALSRTYLPTEALKAEAGRIGILEHMPFLKLPGPGAGEDASKWDFLSAFSVGTIADIAFYIDVLHHTKTLEDPGRLLVPDMVRKVYTTIGKICNLEQAVFVKQKLTKFWSVYVPLEDINKRWWHPNDCLWNAPSCISTRCALANHYGNDNNISTFFRTYLQIQDVHTNDYLDELRNLKRTNNNANGVLVSHRVCAEVYQELHKHQATTELLQHMRQVIESEKLVFVNGIWHSCSECLWSTDTSISDSVSIGGIYANLRGFFVSRLRVKELTLAMLVSDLKKKATAKVPLKSADAKVLIFKINSMLALEIPENKEKGNFTELENVRCFPVRGKDGSIMLTDARTDFAIVDNERFGHAFGQKVDILDVELEDVYTLRPFIEATGLSEHYISGLVKEVSEIEGNAAQNLELSLQLQEVAYALVCCAVHFNSTKVIRSDDSLYKNLVSVQVHEAEKMGTSIVVEQHGRTIKVPSTRTQLKIDTASSPWKVYVPKDEKARKACYISQLPQGILELLGISGINATLAVNRLLNEIHDSESISSVLEQFDVLPISWVKRQPPPLLAGKNIPALKPFHSSPLPSPFGSTQYGDSVSMSTSTAFGFSSNANTLGSSSLFRASTNTNASPTSNRNTATSPLLFEGPRSSSQAFSFSNNTTPVQSVSTTPLPQFRFGSAAQSGSSLPGSELFGLSSTTQSRSVSPSPGASFSTRSRPSTQSESPLQQHPSVQKEKYRALLDNIIRRVSGDSSLWSFNDLAEALPETIRIPMLFDKDETFGVRSDDHLAHDMKIGAAGEVFVFEKLLAAGLPGFNQNDWLSTIRHEAKVHEKYKEMPDTSPDLPAGSRAEPADIVYADPNGDFIKFLETQDCVGLEPWIKTSSTSNRKYFIEVKTTTQNCDAVFHMSKAQHSRMLEMRKKTFTTFNDVYIICRVYNLLSSDIKMRFYVSPGRDETWYAEGSSYTSDVPAGTSSIFGQQEKPILKFTSKGYEVRPVK